MPRGPLHLTTNRRYPLSALNNEPVPFAQDFPDRFEAGGLRRIRSLTDRVWFKLKTGRWRGAVVRLSSNELAAEARVCGEQGTDPCITQEHRWWLGAAGVREDGSRTDFYEEVARAAACPASPEKRNGVDTDKLLPQDWDRKRLRAELAFAERHVYQKVMLQATAASLRSGKVVSAEFSEFSMGVVVRADRGQQFVAFIARNVFDPKRLAVMMDSLPGVQTDEWGPEPGGIADLQPAPGEIIWSALLSPEVADRILDLVPYSESS